MTLIKPSIQVPGEGNPSARIAIVGEAPGAEEARQGRPFVGSSGQLLDQMLSSKGIARSEVYLTNVVKVRPPSNQIDVFYNDAKRTNPSALMLQYREWLLFELDRIKPNIVVALGNEALKALTEKSGIEKWRGSLIQGYRGLKVLPTYHPAYVIRMYGFRTILELDLGKAERHSHERAMPIDDHRFIIDPTFPQAVETLGTIKRERRRVSFDIETCGKYTRCIGFAWSSKEAICIPLMSNRHGVIGSNDNRLIAISSQLPSGSHWQPEEERIILNLIRSILEDPDITVDAQNYTFDSTILADEYGIHIRGLGCDTMLAHHACYPELGKPAGSDDPRAPSSSGKKSLDFLCSIWTDVPRYSDYNAADDRSTWTYNCFDVCVTYEVREALDKEMKELGVDEFYKYQVEPTMYACARMQNRGIQIDTEARTRLAGEARNRIEEAQIRINKKVGRELNPRSPKQMLTFLYEDLMLPKHYEMDKQTRTKRLTANADAIEKLRAKYPEHKPILDDVLSIREDTKLLSTVLEAPLRSDGILTTSFNVAGTVNGRLSSSSNVFGEGMNVQQVHRGEVRRIFIPPEGYVWIKADKSQAEARVVAWSARIFELMNNFSKSDFDIHRWNAANIYGVNENEVTKNQRQLAKIGVHGGNYGLKAGTASKYFGVPFKVAERVLDSYIASLPQLPQWWDSIQDEVRKTRTLVSPLGRRRTFFGRIDDALWRSAYSFIPQAVVVDDINRALWVLDPVLERSSAWPVMQVHDEICVVAPESASDWVVEKMKNVMEYPIKFHKDDPELTIPIDISVGPNWYDQKEIV